MKHATKAPTLRQFETYVKHDQKKAYGRLRYWQAKLARCPEGTQLYFDARREVTYNKMRITSLERTLGEIITYRDRRDNGEAK